MRIRSFLVDRGASVVGLRGPTHVSRHGRSHIDTVAAPVSVAWRWTVQTAWLLALSDHAGLVAGAAPVGASEARALNLAASLALPQAAFTDPKRRFSLLEHIFQVAPYSQLLPHNGLAMWVCCRLPTRLVRSSGARSWACKGGFGGRAGLAPLWLLGPQALLVLYPAPFRPRVDVVQQGGDVGYDSWLVADVAAQTG